MATKTTTTDGDAPPDWLIKLKKKREKIRYGKLGHELGAGAPCIECGEKCPGLDLHFWRKVCRNCKCRKDQHLCHDDDLSGWAQFEILGQIRSKPAFLKIKALTTQPVQLDWVPPNASPDVIADYMEKLGATKIPIAGSEAASKRKQQLEFQVPPHDLDPELCDNLTESEANQLKQYVQKLKDYCVGQGNVIRVGNICHALVTELPHSQTAYPQQHPSSSPLTPGSGNKSEMEQLLPLSNKETFLEDDPILYDIFASEKLQKAIVSEVSPTNFPKIFIAFTSPISETAEEFDKYDANALSADTKRMLSGLNPQAVQSLTRNGPIYDKLLAVIKEKNLDVSRDPKLGPINDFRKAYLNNPSFQREINSVFPTTTTTTSLPKTEDFALNSPLPVKNSIPTRFGAQMRQDTPIRKVRFAGEAVLTNSNSNDSGFESKPPTPSSNSGNGGNFSPFGIDLTASPGKFVKIPEIEEMNMYPTVAEGNKTLSNDFNNLKLNETSEGTRAKGESDLMPPPRPMKCHDCMKFINYGDVAVKAERAGKDIVWHPACFKCYTCHELLADLVYFFHNGQVYCGRDLAIKLKIPRCKACDELIFTKEYTAAENETFHIKHFCCYQCDTPLAGQQYVPDDKTNMPLCLNCYEKFFSAACQRCHVPIGPADQGVAWGDIHWHTQCFRCAGNDCSKSLIGGRFCVKNNLPFCSPACVRSLN